MDLDRRRWLAGLACAGLGWPATATPAPARPALMLARVAPADIDPSGWLVSEKLDGVRGVWDGRTLRLRSGAPIAAPAWFTAGLPAQALDGELWAGPGHFETLVGTVRRAVPDDAGWRDVR